MKAQCPLSFLCIIQSHTASMRKKPPHLGILSLVLFCTPLITEKKAMPTPWPQLMTYNNYKSSSQVMLSLKFREKINYIIYTNIYVVNIFNQNALLSLCVCV